MGTEEDPENGEAVAGAVFGAVFIYVVRADSTTQLSSRGTDSHLGVLRLLRFPSLPSPARKPPRRDNLVMKMSGKTFDSGVGSIHETACGVGELVQWRTQYQSYQGGSYVGERN